MSAISVPLKDVPEPIARKLPRYPIVPATLIGRLAIDQKYRGQGLGEHLLLDALHRSFEQSKVVGSSAVIVDAKEDESPGFYLKYGFIQFKDDRLRLFLPMKTIERLF